MTNGSGLKSHELARIGTNLLSHKKAQTAQKSTKNRPKKHFFWPANSYLCRHSFMRSWISFPAFLLCLSIGLWFWFRRTLTWIRLWCTLWNPFFSPLSQWFWFRRRRLPFRLTLLIHTLHVLTPKINRYHIL